MKHSSILKGRAACQTSSVGRIGAAVTVHKYADLSIDSTAGC